MSIEFALHQFIGEMDWRLTWRLFGPEQLPDAAPVCHYSVSRSKELAEMTNVLLGSTQVKFTTHVPKRLRVAFENLPYCHKLDEIISRYTPEELPKGERPSASSCDPIYGAIYGDIAGGRYPWPLSKLHHTLGTAFNARRDHVSDDTVLTLATVSALCRNDLRSSRGPVTPDQIRMSSRTYSPYAPNVYAEEYRKYGRMFPAAGFAGGFQSWLKGNSMNPYGSLGNGSAMRVSPVGCWYDSVEDVITEAFYSAVSTHNHGDGIFGAVIISVVVWMARMGYTKDQIEDYVYWHLGEGWNDFIDQPLPVYHGPNRELFRRPDQITCSYSVPAALTCFLRSESFFDAIDKALRAGTDADTNASICGAIAAAYYGLPAGVREYVDAAVRRDLCSSSPEVKELWEQLTQKA